MERGTQLSIWAMLFAALMLGCTPSTEPEKARGALQVLLITGGGWHDYEAQQPLLIEAIDERISNIDWTIVHEGNGDPDHKTSVLQEDHWADGYDLVIHNTAFGRVKDAEFVEQFVEHHRGTPAVLIHSAVHSYRYAEPSTAWFEFSGLRSLWHEKERPLKVKNLAPEHPVMADFPDYWQTPVAEELYVVEDIWGDITPLAQIYGIETERPHPVVWTHEVKGTRVFATTLGHHTEMFQQEEFQNMVARGALWALEQTSDDFKNNR